MIDPVNGAILGSLTGGILTSFSNISMPSFPPKKIVKLTWCTDEWPEQEEVRKRREASVVKAAERMYPMGDGMEPVQPAMPVMPPPQQFSMPVAPTYEPRRDTSGCIPNKFHRTVVRCNHCMSIL
jgi:hypothetical protein